MFNPCLLRIAPQASKTPAAPGGVGGGGASLTPFGAEVLERYNRILDRAATNAVDDLAALALSARLDAGPKV